MQETECVLVPVSGMLGLGLRVVLREAGLVPALHRNFGGNPRHTVKRWPSRIRAALFLLRHF